MLSDGARQGGNSELARLNVGAQTVFSRGIRRDVPDARDGDTAEHVTEIVSIKEAGQISYRRGTGKGKTNRCASGQHRAHTPSIQTVRLHRSIGGDDVATSAGLLQRGWQIVTRHGGSRDQKIHTPKN